MDNKEILASIKTSVTNTSLQDGFFESVLKRLESFGYKAKIDDAWVIGFCSITVENHIRNSCNISTIPAELHEIAVDRTCGEFLLALKNTGKLELNELDLSGAITQLKEGDTTIQFANGSSEDEKFTMYLNYLLTKGEGDLVCYRKLKW